MHLRRRAQPQMSVRASVLDKLITQVLTAGLFDADRVATMMRSQRLTDLETVKSYIPAAAQRLGRMWSEDIVGFAEVSIGTARLQALTHEIAGRWTADEARPAQQDVSIMIATMAQEDHTLGAVALCSMMRRLGHNVDLKLGMTPATLLAEVTAGRHDVLMLSCARPQGLETLARAIKDVRRAMENAPIIAVGGAVLDQATDIQEKTDADLVTRDISQILKLAISTRMGRISVVR